MKHVLDTNIAAQYGVNIALLLESFQFWIEKNLSRKKHIHDGLCWSYDTLESLGDIFPYWTKRQIEHTINNAVKHGLLTKGNYNQTKYDRTLWYALTPKAYAFYADLLKEKYLKLLYSSISQNCEIDYTNFRNRFPNIVTPIPDTIPDTDPYIKKDIGDSDESPKINYTQESELNDDSYEKQKSDYQRNHVTNDLDGDLSLCAEGNEEKSDYFEKRIKNKTVSKLNTVYGLKNIQEENIFSIPEQLIQDWITNRNKKRAPITKTAWNKINKELAKCKEIGIDPVDAFEKMVARAWQSLEAEWCQKDNNGVSVSQYDVESVMRA